MKTSNPPNQQPGAESEGENLAWLLATYHSHHCENYGKFLHKSPTNHDSFHHSLPHVFHDHRVAPSANNSPTRDAMTAAGCCLGELF